MMASHLQRSGHFSFEFLQWGEHFLSGLLLPPLGLPGLGREGHRAASADRHATARHTLAVHGGGGLGGAHGGGGLGGAHGGRVHASEGRGGDHFLGGGGR